MPLIGLNATCMHSRPGFRNSGVSVYARNLIRALLEDPDPEHEYVVFCNSDFDPASLPALARARLIFSPAPGDRPWQRIAWEQTGLALAADESEIDVLHGLLNVSPLLAGCRQVVTVHDLTYRTTPRAHPWRRRAWLGVAGRWSLRRAAAVLVDSASTGRDLVEIQNADPDRLVVAYPGLDPDLDGAVDSRSLERFRRRPEVPERFLLFLGTIEPRKNLDRLIAAFALLAGRGYPGKLVIAGGAGWGGVDLRGLAGDAGVSDRLLLPGYVPEADKPFWYSAAEGFVYPSAYEGFGLPVLEAMACGTAVAAADNSSLPEVVGDAGLLFDPNNIDSMVAALEKICSNSNPIQSLKRKGRRRAREFTWAETARCALRAYRMALGG